MSFPVVLARALAHRINIGRGEHGQVEEAPRPNYSTECVAIKIVVNNNNEILRDTEHLLVCAKHCKKHFNIQDLFTPPMMLWA